MAAFWLGLLLIIFDVVVSLSRFKLIYFLFIQTFISSTQQEWNRNGDLPVNIPSYALIKELWYQLVKDIFQSEKWLRKQNNF